MKLSELTWPEVEKLSKDTPVLIPVAALEQHGHHLPLFTDSLLCEEVARRAEKQLSARVLCTPLFWLGNSEHHLDFPGTLSLPPRTYLDVLGAVIDNFVRHGFRRIVFLNGHGGNHVPGDLAMFEARQRYRNRNDLLFLFATYWLLGCRPKDSLPSLVQSQMGHACEWETSMVLRIRPELVGDLSSLTEVEFGNPFLPALRGWTMKDRSVPGHIGNPQGATAEKGEQLFELFTEDAVKLLERVLAWDGQSWNG